MNYQKHQALQKVQQINCLETRPRFKQFSFPCFEFRKAKHGNCDEKTAG